MTRTQLQIDEQTHKALRLRAFKERKSMSAVAREILSAGLGIEKHPNNAPEGKFSFIGSGASGRKDISVRHDEALEEDFR